MDPDPKGADSLDVSSCAPQLEFDAATNRRSSLPARLEVTFGKKNQSDDVVDESENDHERFLLGYNETRKDIYIKVCRVVLGEIWDNSCKNIWSTSKDSGKEKKELSEVKV